MNTPDLIYLASQSPRRRQLLDQLGVRQELLVPDAGAEAEAAEALEAVLPGELPAAYVQRVTLLKLKAARARLKARGLPPAPVLCSDTTVAIGRRILGKPADAAKRLARFTTLRPGSAEGWFLSARALARSGRFSEAVPDYHRAIALSVEPRPEWFVERCHAQLALTGDPATEALAGLDEGLAKIGPLPSLQLLAIEIETRRKGFDAALSRLDTLVAASERKETWLARRGDLLQQAGRIADARAAYRSAGAAIDSLPSGRQRTLAMVELRRELQGKLAALPAGPESAPVP